MLLCNYIMKKILSFLIIIPHVMFVTTLFWLLTTIGQYFYKKEDSASKKENFECGFENINMGEVSIDFKHSIVMSFLILYDIELLLLLPLSFDIVYVSTHGTYVLITTLVLILGTCLLDAETGTLEYDN